MCFRTRKQITTLLSDSTVGWCGPSCSVHHRALRDHDLLVHRVRQTVAQRDVVPLNRPSVDLAGPAELPLRRLHHLLPLGDPADTPRHREDHRKHVDGDPHRVKQDAGVEVDVGVELPGNKVIVLQRDPLQLHCELKQGLVLLPQMLQHLVANLLDDLPSGVEVLVHSVAKAHQPEGVVLVLGLRQVHRDPVNRANLLKHPQCRLVRPTVLRAPQCSHSGRDAGKGVDQRGPRDSDGGSALVLLVVSVQDHDLLQGVGQHRADLVGLAGRGEHHVQKVLRKAHGHVRINEGMPHRVLEAPRSNGGHLGNQPDARQHPVLRVLDVHGAGVVVEGTKCSHNPNHQRHGMRIAAEAFNELPDLLVDHCVAHHLLREHLVLLLAGQLSVQKQESCLQEGALLRELLNRIPRVLHQTNVSVDVRQGAVAVCRGGVPRVVQEQPDLAVQVADINRGGALGAMDQGQHPLLARAVVNECKAIGGHFI
eukprot:RCo007122